LDPHSQPPQDLLKGKNALPALPRDSAAAPEPEASPAPAPEWAAPAPAKPADSSSSLEGTTRELAKITQLLTDLIDKLGHQKEEPAKEPHAAPATEPAQAPPNNLDKDDGRKEEPPEPPADAKPAAAAEQQSNSPEPPDDAKPSTAAEQPSPPPEPAESPSPELPADDPDPMSQRDGETNAQHRARLLHAKRAEAIGDAIADIEEGGVSEDEKRRYEALKIRFEKEQEAAELNEPEEIEKDEPTEPRPKEQAPPVRNEPDPAEKNDRPESDRPADHGREQTDILRQMLSELKEQSKAVERTNEMLLLVAEAIKEINFAPKFM
jgi:hypothetical protein